MADSPAGSDDNDRPRLDAVDRLIVKASEPPARASDPGTTSEVDANEIPVSASYRGHEVSGFLNLETERLRITAMPKAELISSYRSPSSAAVEIVRALNPARQHHSANSSLTISLSAYVTAASGV